MKFWFLSISIFEILFLFMNKANAQWVQTTGPYHVYAFAVSPNGSGGTNIFAGTNDNGVYLSTDNGTNWTQDTSGLTETFVNALTVSSNGTGGTIIIAGTIGGVFLSSNNGTSWTKDTSGLTNTEVNAFAVSGTNIFAGTQGKGVYISTDNGISWTEDSTGLPTNSDVYSLAVSGTNLIAGTFANGVFLSTNDGQSWTQDSTGLPPNIGVYSFTVSGANIFAGTTGAAGIYLSTDSGKSWTQATSGLPPNTDVFSLAVSGTNLYAGTPVGMWRRPLAEMITGIKDLQNNLPTSFSLSQNYPNPFNPSTIISYQVPAVSHVSLRVYDILGNEVASLVDEEKLAGRYSVNFNASKIASGVYFYRIIAGSFVETKKLVLMK